MHQLAAGVREFGEFQQATKRAADWLVSTQDDDGCWRRHPTPFAGLGEKVYETHVAWGLFEADRVLPGKGYGEAGLKQVRWALTWQSETGWFDRCCLSDPARPLTHTLGYALRGILEAHLFSDSSDFLQAARRLANGLRGSLGEDGWLAGRLSQRWRPAADWVCLTGTAQIAHCWLLLYTLTGELDYWNAAQLANRFVRRTVSVDGLPEVRGAVKGSFPVDGDYGRFQYPNWAAKFTVDANMLERAIRLEEN